MSSHITATDALDEELNLLDAEDVSLNGMKLRPSQCYHFEKDPYHLLFNTNCPDSLKERVQSIVKKYLPDSRP